MTLGGDAVIGPIGLRFAVGTATLDQTEVTTRNRLQGVAEEYVRSASWHARNGLTPPTAVVIGHGEGTLGLERAEAVQAALLEQIAAILSGLGDASPPGLTAASVPIRSVAAPEPDIRGSRPAVPEPIAEISVVVTSPPGMARPAGGPGRMADRHRDVGAAMANYRSQLDHLFAFHPTLVVSDAGISARLTALAALMPDLTIEDHSALVFTPDTRRRLAAVATRLTGLDARTHTRLVDVVHDLLASTALVPVLPVSRPAGFLRSQRPMFGHAMHVVSLDVLHDTLSGIAHDLAGTLDPFDHTLGDLGYDGSHPLAQRLARLNLLTLNPAVRQELARDPQFISLVANPVLPQAMLAASSGMLPAQPRTAGLVAVNQLVVARVWSIPGLLLTGRRLADTLDGTLDQLEAADHPILRQPGGRGRLVGAAARRSVAEARTEFDAIRRALQRLLNGDLSRRADLRSPLSELVGRWSSAMQRLSTFAHLRAGAVGVAPGPRPTGLAADAASYLEQFGAMFTVPPMLGNVLIGPALEGRALTERGVAARFWDRVHAAGGIPVATPTRTFVLTATVRGGERLFAVLDPTQPTPQYVAASHIVAWAYQQRAGTAAGYVRHLPRSLGGPILASSPRTVAVGEPWSVDELRPRARLVGTSGGRSLWFESDDPALNVRFDSEARLGRPPHGEVWVHLEGRNGAVYLDGRRVPADVLASVLAAQRVEAGEMLEFDQVMLLICEAGRGAFVVDLRRTLAAELHRPGVRVWATRDVAAVSRTTGTAVAVQAAVDAAGGLQVLDLGQFEETGDDGQAPVGATVPANADVSTDPGPFTQRLNAGWATRPATDPGARLVAGPLSTLAEAYGVPLAHAGVPVQVDLPPVDVAADTAQLLRVPDYEAIVLDLIFAGAGARGLAVVRDSADAGPGRELTVVYDGTRVVFLDRRTGGLGELPAAPAELVWALTGNGT